MTVADLSQRMTALEEAHWIEYYRMEPWGEERADMRSAQVTAMIHNTNAKKPKPLSDFMLFSEKPTKRGNSAAEVRANFNRLIAGQKR